MKLKKLFALLLALAMVLALTACGGNNSNDGDSNDTENGTATTEIDPLTITFTTTYQETETGGLQVADFANYIEEASGGAMKVEVWYGGTVYSDTEVLGAMESGAVNMTLFAHSAFTETLYYLGFPTFGTGGIEETLDFFDYVIFENEETASLIASQLADHDMIFLSTLAGGANALCAKYEFTDLDSLVSGCGAFANFDAAIWEYLGFNVTALTVPDIYNALDTGLADATEMGLSPMVSLTWYEVAPYWALDGTYSAGNFVTANLTWWNGLTDAQRKIIEDAAAYLEEQSISVYADATESDIATVEDATGNKFVTFSDEDYARIWEACFEAKADAAMTVAKNNNDVDNMVTILEAAAKATNYDWTYEG